MMKLAAAAHAIQGRLKGTDTEFLAVNTDTRKLQGADLFVALHGPHFDGHDFLSEAERLGAAGALVSRSVATALPTIEVADTRLALGQLAAHWRQQFAIPLIGVTGSNGKTTVKNMIAAILAETGPGLVTQGNLNNDIGMPLTLLRLRATDRYAVIEMGMNHAGEIDYLTRLAKPTIALVNNAAEAHLAGLGSVEAVARAKGEIFQGLPGDGVAVINADDRFNGLWHELAAPRRCFTFALDHAADVRAQFAPDVSGTDVVLATPAGQVSLRLRLLGRHNVLNAAGAAAAALAAGARLEDIRQGLEKMQPAPGRLEMKRGYRGARVFDDTYNANPGSLNAGMEVLRAASGERVLVLGDMAELGEDAPAIHRRIGERAKSLGIERVFALGDMSRLAVEAFGSGARHFASREALIEALRATLHPEATILIKGSRVMQMEKVVAGITEKEEKR